jgi:hypothetical protein
MGTLSSPCALIGCRAHDRKFRRAIQSVLYGQRSSSLTHAGINSRVLVDETAGWNILRADFPASVKDLMAAAPVASCEVVTAIT